MPRSVRAAGLLACLIVAGVATPAAALEARLTEMRVAGGSIRAALEIREMFPAKFQAILEEGGAIHLRLQIELWEDRPVWDKLAQPSVITIFRIVLDPATRQVTVADRYGEVSRQPAWQEPLVLMTNLGRADALSDTAQYYVRALITLGTIAEKDTAKTTNAVFGEDESSVSIASMGKILFHAVLQVNDYLQSVSSEVRTRDVKGRDVKAGVKLQ
ncbi:MAG TPA: hypothetical protein VNC21_18660 [Vicinamibacterales bacterium]|jgi:hypothetical protein|nr:hypothetical protein [Vicinamibacterales bacterium]